ncbi:MAG: aldo/keto reductase [Oscillospiraceae bacterium]|nr:aldo/keto reductase [Oscillospiraceae bacterium]
MPAPRKKLGFGLMRLPLLNPEDPGSVDVEQVKQMVDSFLEQGFTYFDTAWMYCDGKSEEVAKEALVSRHPRDSFTLTTKLPAYMLKKEEDREWLFNEQLRRTGAGYFDYYWLHDVNSHSIQTFDRLHCWDFIQEKKAAGLVRHIGFSYHDGPELLDQVLQEHSEIEYVQLQLNYLDWDSLGVQSRKCYEVATRHHKPVIVMEPVKGGTLAKVPESLEQIFRAREPEMSVPSWAIRFAASLENVMVVLSGMSNMEQLLDNTGYMQDFKPLNEEEKAMMKTAAEIINGNITVPCTGCSYCTVNCPMNIAIPKYFSLYNLDKQESEEKGWTPQRSYYNNLTLTHGKASDCIRCGQCEAMCPQHLPIRRYLEDVAAYFE